MTKCVTATERVKELHEDQANDHKVNAEVEDEVDHLDNTTMKIPKRKTKVTKYLKDNYVLNMNTDKEDTALANIDLDYCYNMIFEDIPKKKQWLLQKS